jgi:hypothetical protein
VRSSPRRNLDPILVGEQLEASLANLADQAYEIVETGMQPNKGTRSGGEREGEPEGQLEGQLDDEPEGETDARGARDDELEGEEQEQEQ